MQRRLGESVGIGAQGGEQLGDQAVLLLGQGRQHMFLLHGLVGILYRQALGVLQCLDGFLSELIHVHSAYLPYLQIHG